MDSESLEDFNRPMPPEIEEMFREADEYWKKKPPLNQDTDLSIDTWNKEFLKDEKEKADAIILKEIINKVPKMTEDEQTLIIENYEAFFKYGHKNEILLSVKEIKELFDFIHGIGKACGCVRKQLFAKAQQMYRNLLPILEAKYKPELIQWKDDLKKTLIQIKDDGHILIQV